MKDSASNAEIYIKSNYIHIRHIINYEKSNSICANYIPQKSF